MKRMRPPDLNYSGKGCELQTYSTQEKDETSRPKVLRKEDETSRPTVLRKRMRPPDLKYSGKG